MDLIASLHEKRVSQRAALRRAIEAEFEQRLAVIDGQIAVEVAKGAGMGIAKTKLGRAIGTTDWATIQAKIDLGTTLGGPLRVGGRFSWGYRSYNKEFQQGMVWVLDTEYTDITNTVADETHPGHLVKIQKGLVGEPQIIGAGGTTRTDDTAPDGLIDWVREHLGDLG